MRINVNILWLALAILFVGTAPAWAGQVVAPEPVSTSLFLAGGAVLVGMKKFHKK